MYHELKPILRVAVCLLRSTRETFKYPRRQLHPQAHPNFTHISRYSPKTFIFQTAACREPFSPSHPTKAIVSSERDAARIIALSTRRNFPRIILLVAPGAAAGPSLAAMRLRRRFRRGLFTAEYRDAIRFSYFNQLSVSEIDRRGKLEFMSERTWQRSLYESFSRVNRFLN